MSRIRNTIHEILSDAWYRLYRYRFEYLRSDGSWEHQSREVYDRGNGAAVLLYDLERQTVLLVCQFRIPTYVNGNMEGMLTEVCAGVLDEDDPETAIRREILEETGYRIETLEKIGEVYTSPGAVTELLHLYMAPYTLQMKAQSGGGNPDETEDIALLEYSFTRVCEMLRNAEIKDAKTLILLQHAGLFGPLRKAFGTV